MKALSARARPSSSWKHGNAWWVVEHPHAERGRTTWRPTPTRRTLMRKRCQLIDRCAYSLRSSVLLGREGTRVRTPGLTSARGDQLRQHDGGWGDSHAEKLRPHRSLEADRDRVPAAVWLLEQAADHRIRLGESQDEFPVKAFITPERRPLRRARAGGGAPSVRSFVQQRASPTEHQGARGRRGSTGGPEDRP